jgi:hypothetical protein
MRRVRQYTAALVASSLLSRARVTWSILSLNGPNTQLFAGLISLSWICSKSSGWRVMTCCIRSSKGPWNGKRTQGCDRTVLLHRTVHCLQKGKLTDRCVLFRTVSCRRRRNKVYFPTQQSVSSWLSAGCPNSAGMREGKPLPCFARTFNCPVHEARCGQGKRLRSVSYRF